MSDDDDQLTPKRLQALIKTKKQVCEKLRKKINSRLQAHRVSERPALKIDELADKCKLNDFHRTILIGLLVVDTAKPQTAERQRLLAPALL